jgi:hypothetical protein
MIRRIQAFGVLDQRPQPRFVTDQDKPHAGKSFNGDISPVNHQSGSSIAAHSVEG